MDMDNLSYVVFLLKQHQTIYHCRGWFRFFFPD